MSSPRRLVVANLTAEEDLAGRRGGLSARAVATVSSLATLLRAFAREGDVLHLPAAVDAELMAEVPGLPRPRLAAGRLDRLARPEAVLAWAETAAVQEIREAPSSAAVELPPEADLAETLWQLPPPLPGAVALANHRGFCLETAEALGVALPGARMIASIGDIAVGLRGGEGSWILKAPLSAAGRERLRVDGAAALPGAVPRLEALLARHGSLLLEPWMDRTEDFGCAAVLTEHGLRRVAFHRQLTDRQGQPMGFRLPVSFRGEIPLFGEEREALDRTLEGVAAALRRIGYRGPFGLDLWRHRLADGRTVLHPLGEINARMTLGLVARALADRLRGPLGWEEEGEVELKLGATAPASSREVHELLAPGPGGAPGAWISETASQEPSPHPSTTVVGSERAARRR